MITRDSHFWWFVMGGSLLIAVSSRFDLLDPLLPVQHTQTIHAVIELLAYLAGVSAGVLRMSPLPISQEGRQQAIKTKAELAGSAQRAVAQAAVEMDKAAVATDKAAEAAEGAQKAVDKVANT